MRVFLHRRALPLLFLLVLLAACESRPAFPPPEGREATIALDVEFARWTLDRWSQDGFGATLTEELAKYNIKVVDRHKQPSYVARIDLGLWAYRNAVDIYLLRGEEYARLPRVMVPDLQTTTLDVAAQLIAAVIAKGVWSEERDVP
jgi:hypothetical protein